MFIYKKKASSSDSSAIAGFYKSYQKVGAVTNVITESGRVLKVTRFQPLAIVPMTDPYKFGVIRGRHVNGFQKTLLKYQAIHKKYQKARPLIAPHIDEYERVVEHLLAGRGYYQSSWMKDSLIDEKLANELQRKKNVEKRDSLKYFKRLRLRSGKVYREVYVKKKGYDSIQFQHEGGAMSAKLKDLPYSVKKELGEFGIEIEERELKKKQREELKRQKSEAEERRIQLEYAQEKARIETGRRKLEREKREREEAKELAFKREVFKKQLPTLLESLSEYEGKLASLMRPLHHRSRDMVYKSGVTMNVTEDGFLVNNVYLDEVFFIVCNPGSTVDGEKVGANVYRNGVFKYTALNGSAKTVAKYVVDLSYDKYLEELKLYKAESSDLERKVRSLKRDIAAGKSL